MIEGHPDRGLPPQTALLSGRAAFTEAYAVIPHSVMSDIVISRLPFWRETRAWVLARPLSGFAETFSQYVMEVKAGGGSDSPEPDPAAQAVLYVTEGRIEITIEGEMQVMEEGGYAYLPPGCDWSLRAVDDAEFHWIRKAYQWVPGIDAPEPFVTHRDAANAAAMPDSDGVWATTTFVDADDLSHDMHVNIVTFEPGGVIPFMETHVMEHGLYVLEGKAVYRLNRDWVEVEAGDFMWLRAFCPQACYAGGPGKFEYLLYKDVNRHATLLR